MSILIGDSEKIVFWDVAWDVMELVMVYFSGSYSRLADPIE